MNPYRVVPLNATEHVRPVRLSVFVVLPAVSVRLAVAGAQLTVTRGNVLDFSNDHVVLRLRLKWPFAKAVPLTSSSVKRPQPLLHPSPHL